MIMVGGGVLDKKFEFRRGICHEHKLKEDKSTTKCKVWRKKKFGNGYFTITKVTYSCSVEVEW